MEMFDSINPACGATWCLVLSLCFSQFEIIESSKETWFQKSKWTSLIMFFLVIRSLPRGGYSHTLGIYGCATLMGEFLKRVAPMMGAFLSILAPNMGTILEIWPSPRFKNGHFYSKWPQFVPIMGGFSTNFAPMMGVFFHGSPQMAFTLLVIHT